MDLQVTAQLLGNFGEFLGAIAVVATLGYLTVQIRQNTKALRIAGYSDFVDRHIQMVKFAAEHVEVITQVDDYRGLPVKDRAVHVAYMSGTLRNGDALHCQWQQGLLDDQRWCSSLASIAGTVAENPVNRQIWSDFKYRYSEAFRREVDSYLERRG
jgi:hypothetical protein